MVKLVPSINTKKYYELTTKAARVGYLRALAIGTLIEDAVRIFMENEEGILEGAFAKALLDKSKYEAQIQDILKISISNIYQSQEVIEKEIAGYEILTTLLDTRCKALEETTTHYDKLILKIFGDAQNVGNNDEENLYNQLLYICNQISLMTDGQSLQLFQKIKGLNVLD